MTIARLRVAGQETWHRDVVRADFHDDYLTLHLTAHPSRVHYWLGKDSHTSVLLCADGDEVTRALRDERPENDYSGYCTCLSIGRDPLCPVHGDYDKVGVR